MKEDNDNIDGQRIDGDLTNSMAYGTQRLNAAFTTALQLSLSWAKSTQFPAISFNKFPLLSVNDGEN